MNADFRGKVASPTNHSWYQSNRVIALSCGIKISAVRHLVLSQCTRVRTDKQTDGWTDRITTPKTALAYARVVKMLQIIYNLNNAIMDLSCNDNTLIDFSHQQLVNLGLPVQRRLAGQTYIFCCCTFFFFFDTGTCR